MDIINRKGKTFIDVTEKEKEYCPECGHRITEMLDPVMRVKFGHECARCGYKKSTTLKQNILEKIKL